MVLKVWFVGPWGIPETLPGCPQKQKYFHNNIKALFTFHHIDICTDDAKAIVDKHLGALGSDTKLVIVGFFTSSHSQ